MSDVLSFPVADVRDILFGADIALRRGQPDGGLVNASAVFGDGQMISPIATLKVADQMVTVHEAQLSALVDQARARQSVFYRVFRKVAWPIIAFTGWAITKAFKGAVVGGVLFYPVMALLALSLFFNITNKQRTKKFCLFLIRYSPAPKSNPAAYDIKL